MWLLLGATVGNPLGVPWWLLLGATVVGICFASAALAEESAGEAAREGVRLGAMLGVEWGRALEVGPNKTFCGWRGAEGVGCLRAAAALTFAMRERTSAGDGVAV
jgi:hypothetical protein